MESSWKWSEEVTQVLLPTPPSASTSKCSTNSADLDGLVCSSIVALTTVGEYQPRDCQTLLPGKYPI